ncbi:MAG TPA: hypothetical protein PKL78_07180 [Anaerolineales bacterium]|nr:hypothetical protein [Anaerolineales bacterium]
MVTKYFYVSLRGGLVMALAWSFISLGSVEVAQAAAGDAIRVSVDSSGGQANAMTYLGHISADGRFVVFDSEATNLVNGDSNGAGDVFIRDLQVGTTALVTRDAAGIQANAGGGAPWPSADGRFVAFESGSTNLTASDVNGFSDIFVKDLQTGAVALASTDSTGSASNGDSQSVSISGDGRYVAFMSDASNLVPNDVNGFGDVFVHDMQMGTTIGVSVAGNAGAFDPSISTDGRFVVFNSRSDNLVANDTNGVADVFVYALQTGQITRASVNSSGIEGDHSSSEPSISGDGRYVVFSTASNNFTTADTYGYTQLYIRDMQNGSTTLATFKDGFAMVGTSDASEISADGRYIVYSFDDKGDGMPTRWLYLHDRITATNTLVVSAGTMNYDWNPLLPSISGDGRFIVFASSSPNFAAGDTNGVRDIFLKDLYAPDPPPAVLSISHACPNGCGSSADQFFDFQVKFSKSVSGVDAGDFLLTSGGGIAGAVVSTVSGAGSEYIVHVNTGSGDGTLRLDVIDDDSIKDSQQNPLGGAGMGNGNFTSGDWYSVDKSTVVVTDIVRLDPSPTSSGSVRFAVNFSEPVTSVDAGDFVLFSTGGISVFAVTEVGGSGAAYTVTVNTGMGDGTLRLDLVDDDSILDVLSVPLGGVGLGNGNFTGEAYSFDRTAPVVLSIQLLDPNPTAAETVRFGLTFSEPVRFIDVSNFALTANGPVGLAIPELSIEPNFAIVTVATGTGNGTIQLSLIDDDSLVDATGNPLGGVGAGNGNFAGPFYSINKKTNESRTEKLRSNGWNDGWVLESSEGSGIGGVKNYSAEAFRIGDDTRNRQYRAILHFPTNYLPDNAVVTQAILMIKLQGQEGADPFAGLGGISIDIHYGPFGSFGPFGINLLQVSDFQEPASLASVGLIQNNPVGGWYWGLLSPSAFSQINRTGVTQLRLAFQTPTDHDLQDDFLQFISGDHVEQRDRPHLLIDYYVP